MHVHFINAVSYIHSLLNIFNSFFFSFFFFKLAGIKCATETWIPWESGVKDAFLKFAY